MDDPESSITSICWEPIFPTITAACILVVATITVLAGLLSIGDTDCPSEAFSFHFPAVPNSLLLHDPAYHTQNIYVPSVLLDNIIEHVLSAYTGSILTAFCHSTGWSVLLLVLLVLATQFQRFHGYIYKVLKTIILDFYAI